MSRQKIIGWIHAAVVFVWPFVYLFPYVVPINGRYLQIGNDFNPYYYKYKVYLLSLLNSFHFPLWSPSEAAGYPFAASPFSQAFYPFNLLLALFYRIAHGYTYLDDQRFTVLGVSIFGVGVYLWLRSLHIERRPALFAALVMSTSFKVVEIIRDPNAVHTACWYPWILYAITKIVSSSSKGQKALYGILLVFSGFCLITAGYPYFLYYSSFLIAPYGVLILIPALRRRLFNLDDDHPLQTWITLGTAGVFLVAATSPYLIQIVQLMNQTTDRGGASFRFATVNLFNFPNTLGSLVYPPESRAEGWYHFGFVGLFLISIFLLGRTKPKDQNSPLQDNPTVLKWILVGWLVLISYITYGKDSVLFALLFRLLPGFSNLREWGKMNIILVPIIAWLLALAYQYFEDLVVLPEKPSWNAKKLIRTGIWLLAGSMLVILGIQSYFIYRRMHDRYWTAYFLIDFLHAIPDAFQHSRWMPPVAQINHILIVLIVVLGFLSFLGCLFFLLKALLSKSFPVHAMLTVFIILTALDTFIISPWMWTAGWADLPQRETLDLLTADAQSFNSPRTNVQDTIMLSSTFNVGIIASWYFDRYSVFYNQAIASEPAAGNLFLGVANGQKIYYSSSISPVSIQAFLEDAGRFPQVARVSAYNGDFLDLTVTAPANGYLSFIDNWDPYWRAWVDGHRVEVLRLFGTFKSVQVSKGPHQIEFAYCPPIFEILNPSCSTIR